jgi:predicted nucleotidyltransferase
MFQDFNELLSVFNAHRVKYLVVGGYAVSFHAQPRATKDIDLFIKPDTANAKSVFTALAEFGAPMEGLTTEDFSQRGKFFRMGREPVAVDILTEIDGIDFDAAWENRVEGVIDTPSGLKAYFISGADLIAAKIAAGRPQDIADAEALRKASQI